MTQRERIRMSDAEIAAFLDERLTMSVATLDPDGWPHLVAMWYVMRDGDVHFWTYAKSRKAVNLRRDPRVTCMVESGERYDQLRGLSIAGRGVLIEDTQLVTDIGMAISERYYGEAAVGEQRDALRAGVEAQAPKRVGVRIEVERLASWDHSKLVS